MAIGMMGSRFGLRPDNLVIYIFAMADFQNLNGDCLLMNSINDPVIANPYSVHVF